jgi:hypothetical protein
MRLRSAFLMTVTAAFYPTALFAQRGFKTYLDLNGLQRIFPIFPPEKIQVMGAVTFGTGRTYE